MTPLPNPQIIDFVGDIPRLDRTERHAPDDFLIRHLDPLTACKVNFVPIMLRSLVMAYARPLADAMAEARVDGAKAYTRVLRTVNAKDDADFAKDKTPWQITDLRRYTDRYKADVHTDIWLFLRDLEVQAKNKLPGKSPQLYALLTLTALLAHFARRYELNMNDMLSDITGVRVSKKEDPYTKAVYEIAVTFAREFGYYTDLNDNARLWTEILSNRALALCERCYNEEYPHH